MGLEALIEAGKAISQAFSGVSGLGSAFVVAGLTILLVIGIGFGLYALIRLVKQIPRMTVWEFIKFTVLFAIALIIVGIIIP